MNTERSPKGFSYGVEYTRLHINDEIDGSPAGVVRTEDTIGHGTHVAVSGSNRGVRFLDTPDGGIFIDNASTGNDPGNGDRNGLILIFDARSTRSPRTGTWKIIATGATVAESGHYDNWLFFSQVGREAVYFDAASASVDELVAIPGVAARAITVGAYSTKTSWVDYLGRAQTLDGAVLNDLAYFSSVGPTRDDPGFITGRQKPVPEFGKATVRCRSQRGLVFPVFLLQRVQPLESFHRIPDISVFDIGFLQLLFVKTLRDFGGFDGHLHPHHVAHGFKIDPIPNPGFGPHILDFPNVTSFAQHFAGADFLAAHLHHHFFSDFFHVFLLESLLERIFHFGASLGFVVIGINDTVFIKIDKGRGVVFLRYSHHLHRLLRVFCFPHAVPVEIELLGAREHVTGDLVLDTRLFEAVTTFGPAAVSRFGAIAMNEAQK
ncbi:MAG: hypothetical protein ACE5IY_22475 [bacterium]